MASNAPYRFVRNSETGEVFESVASADWTVKLTAWREAYRQCASIRDCPIPSPMPRGHVMFLRSTRRRPSVFVPVEEIGAEVWQGAPTMAMGS